MLKKGSKLGVLLSIAAMLLLTAACGGAGTSGSGGGGLSSPQEPAAPASTPDPAAAGDVAFPEKNMTLVVPYKAGGGYDRFARLIAPIWEKELGTTIVVKNIAGGNATVGINAVRDAEPDGYTVGVYGMSDMAVTEIMGEGNFKMADVNWIGQVGRQPHLIAASKKSGITSLDDLKGKEVIVGTSSTGTMFHSLEIAKKVGFEPKFINHPGTNEVILAAIRGDIDLISTNYPAVVPSSSELNILAFAHTERLPELPDVPTVVELGYPELADILNMTRLIGTTPGIPQEHLDVLQDSLKKTVESEEFKEKLAAEIIPMYANAEESKAIVDRIQASSLDIAEEVKKLLAAQ